MIPLNEKLSYIWERVTRQATMYSPVFERATTSVWRSKYLRDNWKAVATSEYHWMKATPVAGEGDLYTVCEVFSFDAENGEIWQDSYPDRDCPSDGNTTHMSAAEAMRVMLRAAMEWEKNGFKRSEEQPFRARMVDISTPGADAGEPGVPAP